MTYRIHTALAGALLLVAPMAGQGHQHTPGMTHPAGATVTPPQEGGQAAFAAIAEIVARLEADPATDWSKVNIEALRQHLIDMDNVVMRSRVAARPVDGGFVADVTGEGAVIESIRRMLTAHLAQMSSEGALKGTAESIPGGVRLTVVAASPTDSAAVSRLRGLGVIGFLALSNHHGPHHEGMARGVMVHAH